MPVLKSAPAEVEAIGTDVHHCDVARGPREMFRPAPMPGRDLQDDSLAYSRGTRSVSAWFSFLSPFDYPLCSDFWPHGDVSRKYGVLRADQPFTGASERAIFVVGKHGKIEFSKIYPVNQVPDLQETLAVLSRL